MRVPNLPINYSMLNLLKQFYLFRLLVRVAAFPHRPVRKYERAKYNTATGRNTNFLDNDILLVHSITLASKVVHPVQAASAEPSWALFGLCYARSSTNFDS